MVLSWDLVNLFLYCAQQFGVMMGAGAEVVLLFSYLSALRDGVVEPAEERMARAVHAALNTGLVLIILSGAAISGIHYLAGDMQILLEPAYLFKWALIAAALVFTVGVSIKWPLTFIEGLAGGTWLSLFLVHILAPVTTWSNLLQLYAVWMAGFFIIWITLVLSLRGKKPALASKPLLKPMLAPTPKPAPAPKPASVKPDMPKKPLFGFFAKKPAEPVITPTVPAAAPMSTPSKQPIAPMPVVPAKESPLSAPPPVPMPPVSPTPPAAPAPAAPAADPTQASPELPAIRVMPKVGDVAGQDRATLVTPNQNQK